MGMFGLLVMGLGRLFLINKLIFNQQLPRLLPHDDPTPRYPRVSVRWNFAFGGLLIIMVFLISACDAGSTASSPKSTEGYPILDSGFGSGIEEVYWLDGQHVIFGGYEGEKPKRVEERHNVKRGIYIWNIETNAVSLFARDGLGYCYHEGKIYYFQGSTWVVDWQEVKRTGMIRPELIDRNKVDYRSLNCLRQGRPHGADGRAVYLLLPEHGYLDIGPVQRGGRRKNMPLTYFPASKQSHGIGLPIGQRQVDRMRFIDFKGAYLLTGPKFDGNKGYAESWQPGVDRPVWWLYPDGRFEETILPFRKSVLGGSVVIHATSMGFVVVSHAVGRNSKSPGNAGIWLSTPDALIKIVAGVVDGASVSSNGCKVAFAYAPNLLAIRSGTPGRRTLQYVDVCNSQGEDV